jgi:hypothetical protein
MSNLSRITRRRLLRTSMTAAAAGMLHTGAPHASAADAPPAAVHPAPLVHQDPSVEILHPRGRVPVSFIIDDSTCLVNMGSYCMPQFAAAWPNQTIYKRPWKDWPREIPDAFVREFGEWCAHAGVRGKYSLVPYPACVGWLDRELPGWSRADLQASLKLVRDLILPSWDVTPEMITHTRVIDLKTGRPLEPIGPATMENSYPPAKQSADELAPYIAYALRILKNCDIPCTGITTPGGFGNKCKPELALAVRQAVADVFAPEIPFYFKYISQGAESTRPKLEAVEGVGTDALKFVVNVPAGTGDEFGGWDGDRPPQQHLYSNDDATGGRMVELIQRGEPAVMFCHWAGLYSHGTKAGFTACKAAITAINHRFADQILWQKPSEMARHAAARHLTRIDRTPTGHLTLTAPIPTPAFTLRLAKPTAPHPTLRHPEANFPPLKEVPTPRDLQPNTWLRQGPTTTFCFDLPKGTTTLIA